ncbi:MAG: long-chain fatty acid--CoA ligase [Gammaproteobacteria bacterium TMED104]|nr:MAG: long-chain fatty acid--CoA ligase [Gammaproteobacteria bacterium TMED104]|tara:strand:- start:6601 stop:8256 length:1656 start_codon:yes stop_codon:yes gene_type:complete
MHTDQEINNIINENDFFKIGNEDVLGQSLPVFINRPRNLAAFISQSQHHAESIYLEYQGKKISFKEHYELVGKAIHLLRSKYNVGPGDRVAIYAANSPEWIIFFWATVSIGAIACGLNGWWNGKEAIKALDAASPKLLVGDEKRISRLSSHDHSQTIFEELVLTDYPNIDHNFHEANEDDCACLLYTSGTTGTPKGVMTSHRSMISNTMLQLLQGASVAARSSKLGTDWSANKPKSLITSPLFHVSGLSAGAVTALFAGTSSYLYDGKFDAVRVVEIIKNSNITSWGGAVPTALRRVLNVAEKEKTKLESLLVVGGGGAPIPEELINKSKIVFPNVKYNFGYGYGLTESGAITIINWGDKLDSNPTSPGQPMPTIHVELRDDNGELILDDDVEGEIYVKSPSVMLGYYENPTATAESLTEDRTLKTGDFAYRKNGLFFISSRRTDLILRGAENVYPQEIELLLDAHPKVIESAVIGIPDEDLGQQVKAFIRIKADVNTSELEKYLEDNLAKFKVPSTWEIIDPPLPRNASGKVMKHVLIDKNANNMIIEND